MKKLIWLIILVIIGLGIYLIMNSGAPDDVEVSQIEDAKTEEINPELDMTLDDPNDGVEKVFLTSFNFEGYGPGKTETGTFGSYAITDVSIENSEVKSGKLTFKASSINTGKDGLNTHLCSDDFFDCEKYPDITFVLSKVEPTETSSEYKVTGNLSFHGVTKSVSFNVNKTPEGEYSADFKLDTTPFGMKYIAVDKEVRIQFTGNIK